MRAKRIFESEDIAVMDSILDSLEKQDNNYTFKGKDTVNLPDGQYVALIKGWEAVIENPKNPQEETHIEMDGGVRGSTKGEVIIQNGEAYINVKG